MTFSDMNLSSDITDNSVLSHIKPELHDLFADLEARVSARLGDMMNNPVDGCAIDPCNNSSSLSASSSSFSYSEDEQNVEVDDNLLVDNVISPHPIIKVETPDSKDINSFLTQNHLNSKTDTMGGALENHTPSIPNNSKEGAPVVSKTQSIPKTTNEVEKNSNFDSQNNIIKNVNKGFMIGQADSSSSVSPDITSSTVSEHTGNPFKNTSSIDSELLAREPRSLPLSGASTLSARTTSCNAQPPSRISELTDRLKKYNNSSFIPKNNANIFDPSTATITLKKRKSNNDIQKTTTKKRVTFAAEPVIANTEPVVSSAKPVVTNVRPAVTNARPTAANAKPAVTNRKPVVMKTKEYTLPDIKFNGTAYDLECNTATIKIPVRILILEGLSVNKFIEEFEKQVQLSGLNLDVHWYALLDGCFKKSRETKGIKLYLWFTKRLYEGLSWWQAQAILRRHFGFDNPITKERIHRALLAFKQLPDEPFGACFDRFRPLARACQAAHAVSHDCVLIHRIVSAADQCPMIQTNYFDRIFKFKLSMKLSTAEAGIQETIDALSTFDELPLTDKCMLFPSWQQFEAEVLPDIHEDTALIEQMEREKKAKAEMEEMNRLKMKREKAMRKKMLKKKQQEERANQLAMQVKQRQMAKKAKKAKKARKLRAIQIENLKNQGLCTFCGVVKHSFRHHQVCEARIKTYIEKGLIE